MPDRSYHWLHKPTKPAEPADYSGLALPKRKRIVDRKAIEACRKDFCEVCGRKGAPHLFERHHVTRRSCGGGFGKAKRDDGGTIAGDDVAGNLINLCLSCHRKAGLGIIPRSKILAIIREREAEALKASDPKEA